MPEYITKFWVRDDVVLITMKHLPSDIGIIASIFEAFSENDINIDLISQTPPDENSYTDIYFSIVEGDLNRTLEMVARYQKQKKDVQVDINPGHTKLTLYGELFRDTPGIAAKIFRALADADIEVKLITTSEVDVSVLISSEDVDKTVSKLTETFGVEAE